MAIFTKKIVTENNSPLQDQLLEQAKRLGISVDELKKLGEGKSCPKYGTAEILHARRTRGGKITVFNISEKHRVEKISAGRKLLREKKAAPVDPQAKA